MATCRGCDFQWSSVAWAHCSAPECHRTFTSTAGFDIHRRNGKCNDPSRLIKLTEEGERERLLHWAPVAQVWSSSPDYDQHAEVMRAKLATSRGTK